MRSPMTRRALFPLVALGLLLAHAALAAGGAHGGIDMLPILEALALIIVLARLGGAAAVRLGLPEVLGELIVGILIGNLGLVGFDGFKDLQSVPVVEAMAQIGVLFLLFRVGLESDIGKMMAVGGSATLVAVLGVVAPMLLGLGVSEWFLSGHHHLSHFFVGATLAATSVGITARVLGDLGRSGSVEGRIILGAAVIDDVLGLIVLAVVTGLIEAVDAGSTLDPVGILYIIGKAFGFLVAAGCRSSRSASRRGSPARACCCRSRSRSASSSRSSPARPASRPSSARSRRGSCWTTCTTRRCASETTRSATCTS